ncbi:MAG: hypothetical protein KGL39_53055 [Patescibacteria group bacterium]|nr:hypothetical protein [Patescibacteria group bacterium]
MQRRISIVYFDRAGYVVQSVTPLISTDPVVPDEILNAVKLHAPNPALSATVQLRQMCEPLLYDLAPLANTALAGCT